MYFLKNGTQRYLLLRDIFVNFGGFRGCKFIARNNM